MTRVPPCPLSLPRRALLLAAPLLLPACMSLAPPHAVPPLPVPGTLDAPAPTSAPLLGAPGDAAQPLFVQDARLRTLLGQALADNRDLRLALLAVERARAQYGIAQADLLPGVTASGAASRARTAEDLTASGRSSTASQFSASVGLAAYEIDFWGRVRNLNEAALQEFLRTQDSRDSVRVALVADVILAWLNLDADARRLQLARGTLRAREQQLQLTRRTRELGAASGLTLAQVQTTVDAARADVAAYQAQVARDRNALALLVGTPVADNLLPDSVAAALQGPEPLPPLGGAGGTAAADGAPASGTGGTRSAALAVPAPAPATALPAIAPGLPSSVLLARPDVRAAEHALAAASAQIGVARAAFFPSISLTASVGTASNALSGLFAGGNGTWSFAPQIRLPIFDAGRNRANLRVAEVARDSAIAQYERAIQAAFRDARDALADRATLGERLAAQQSLVAASAQVLELSQARFRLGADSYLAVLDAERSLYAAQQSLIALQLAEQANRVQLYRALGGQWRAAGAP
ncbi:efflux transporter, outer membrane factor (OMF) lipoprotein, NodT family [Oryzisolibacter propanilivorax]|uniref:Efflux transporter, outer membrane factor (OMF) lipoprotein, NodT family n=1 Tax=Oryzisolibacter propanilivorax TaxID=1527607 RepID=A0A1G9P141_9BURK|nr:TolC family protein [Oryzisolibacter propanilivorax]SDL92508.1 efflux transporter, outer membrane factor (OMF) lipoprotein, NodT family [Oryzisolibacter propanilivorax]